MLTFTVQKPPTVHLGTCRYLFRLYGDRLSLKLRHCSCRQIELDVEGIVFVSLYLDVDGIHIELDDELGVDVKIVEGLVIPIKIIKTRMVWPVHKRLHRFNTIDEHDGLSILVGEVQDVVNDRCILWFPNHNHINFEEDLGIE